MLVALIIAASIAGKPVGIHCDADRNNPFPFPVDGWAMLGADHMHLHPEACRALERRDPSDPEFARALGVLIHESAHLRGVDSEACAELYASVLIYQVLQQHYRVAFFTNASRRIAERVRALTLARPPLYHPTPSSCDDQP